MKFDMKNILIPALAAAALLVPLILRARGRGDILSKVAGDED